MNQSSHYKGYEVLAAATPLHNGLFAAKLMLDRAAPHPNLVQFDELDYFFEEEQALAYATRWGKMWIDNAAGA